MAKYITPVFTPMTAPGCPDWEAAEALYEFVIQGGVDGILVLGSIGEFFALSPEDKQRLISLAVKTSAGRVPVIAGTGDMLFERVTGLSLDALEAGADAVIVVPPFYFRLEPEQIEAYYDRLAETVTGRIYIYNFPDRTGYSISPEVIRRLALRHENIIGCKDTIPGMDHTREIIRAVKPDRPDFEIYSGFDDNFAHNVLSGGDGCIAGLSNIVPELAHQWVRAVNTGDWASSARLQQVFDRLMAVYAVGAPFIPFIKCAAALRGLPVRNVSGFPFPAVTPAQQEQLKAILGREGLIR